MKSFPTIESHTQHILDQLTDDDVAKERAWEKAMWDRGRIRYERAINTLKTISSEATTDYGIIIIKKNIDKVREGIDSYLAKSLAGGKGRHATAAKLIEGMDSNIIAFLALRKMIDSASKNNLIVQNVAASIGAEIMMEKKLSILKEDDNYTFTSTKHYLRHSHGRKYTSTVLNIAFSKSLSANFETWASHDRTQLGIRLIDIICDTTGLFDIVMQKSKDNMFKKRQKYFYYLEPSKQLNEWIANYNEYAILLAPDYYPTLIPPRPWESFISGGYWFQPKDLELKLMKVIDKDYIHAVNSLLINGHIEEVRQAVNSLQNTAWKINTRVFDVAKYVWDTLGGNRAGLPSRDMERLPLCPFCGHDITDTASSLIKHDCFEHPHILKYKALKKELNDTIAPTDDEDKALHALDPDELETVQMFRKWKREAKDMRNLNAEIAGKKRGVSAILKIATAMSKHPRFYFPYQLDFRTRMYTIPSFLSPQGTDLAKGLLCFAEAKPLRTMEAVKWLAIQCANTWGEDKISFDDRYSWTIQHQDKILACAEDPYSETWWMDADDPFCFLAACFEWQGYVKEGLSYKSSIPVAMDGSCNGLQLFSLMLRDEVGGRATNLVPDVKPNDVYKIVAEKVILKLENIVSDPANDVDKVDEKGRITNDYKDAKALLELGITRKTTKRQVMTLPYGSTFQSCIEYTREWMRESSGHDFGFAGHTHLDLEDRILAQRQFRHLSLILAQYIWQSINETVIKARQAMDYLQEMVKLVNAIGKPIYWSTPCGIPIRQQYNNYKPLELRTLLGDKITKLRIQGDILGTNKIKQVNSISPNFIHSYDASALIKTICTCAEEQSIHAFAMIHDSYGTHATDAPVLAKVLRQTFINMFKDHDYLKAFEAGILTQYPELTEVKKVRLPERPEFGSLSIDDLANSLYFFG